MLLIDPFMSKPIPSGEAVYTSSGTFNWVCPPGVFSVCVVAIGKGGHYGGTGPHSGSGGGLGWKNNIPVTPGQTYLVVVNQTNGATYFISTATVCGYGGSGASFGSGGSAGGGFTGDGGGIGGRGISSSEAGGGGAGGYLGKGGDGGYGQATGNNAEAGSGGGGGGGGSVYYTFGQAHDNGYGYTNAGNGGGTGLYGVGATGQGGTSPSDGYGGSGGGYGGGGGFGGYTYSDLDGGNYAANRIGRPGALRIMWGAGKSFPYNAGP